jgi:hypothetical protein
LTSAHMKLDDARQAHLKGKARQDYSPIGDLELIGSGADQWRTSGGARGVTGYFYDPSGDHWFSASVARAAGQDPLFDPANAYRSEALWGAGALEKLCKVSFFLKSASASATGRLSMAQGVQAKLNLNSHAPKPQLWPCYCTDWSMLSNRLEKRFTGSLSKPRTISEPVILAPRRMAKPIFDDLSQTLSWAVEDSEGRWLSLDLEHDSQQGTAMMASLETMTQSGWRGAIVALASVEGGHYVLRPFALLEDEKLFSLGLDPLPQAKKATFGGFAGRVLTDIANQLGRLPQQFAPLPKSSTQMLLASCWQILVEMAEIGVALNREKSINDIAICARLLTDAGLPSLAVAIALIKQSEKLSQSAFLQAAYAIRLAQRQLTSLPIVQPIA